MLKRPIISEKSMGLAKQSFYTFEVSKTLNKNEIARLVHLKFGVDVASVRTVTLPAKQKPQRSRRGFYTKTGLKKAIVILKNNQKIALFETVNNVDNEATVTTDGGEATVKEKKSLLKGTKVKVEKMSSEDVKKNQDKKKGSK